MILSFRSARFDARCNAGCLDEHPDFPIQQFQLPLYPWHLALLQKEGVRVWDRARWATVWPHHDWAGYRLASYPTGDPGRPAVGLSPVHLILHHTALGRRFCPWVVLDTSFRTGIDFYHIVIYVRWIYLYSVLSYRHLK